MTNELKNPSPRNCFIHNALLKQQCQLVQSNRSNEFRRFHIEKSFQNIIGLDRVLSECVQLAIEKKNQTPDTAFKFMIQAGQLFSTKEAGQHSIDYTLFIEKVLKYMNFQTSDVFLSEKNLKLETNRVRYEIDIKCDNPDETLCHVLCLNVESNSAIYLIEHDHFQPKADEIFPTQIYYGHISQKGENFKKMDILDLSHPEYSFRMNFFSFGLKKLQTLDDPNAVAVLTQYLQQIRMSLTNLNETYMEIQLPGLPAGYRYEDVRRSHEKKYRLNDDECYFIVSRETKFPMVNGAWTRKTHDDGKLSDSTEIFFVNPKIEELLGDVNLDENQIKDEIEKAWQYGERMMKQFDIQYS